MADDVAPDQYINRLNAWWRSPYGRHVEELYDRLEAACHTAEDKYGREWAAMLWVTGREAIKNRYGTPL